MRVIDVVHVHTLHKRHSISWTCEYLRTRTGRRRLLGSVGLPQHQYNTEFRRCRALCGGVLFLPFAAISKHVHASRLLLYFKSVHTAYRIVSYRMVWHLISSYRVFATDPGGLAERREASREGALRRQHAPAVDYLRGGGHHGSGAHGGVAAAGVVPQPEMARVSFQEVRGATGGQEGGFWGGRVVVFFGVEAKRVYSSHQPRHNTQAMIVHLVGFFLSLSEPT